jgi:hypothetical protein
LIVLSSAGNGPDQNPVPAFPAAYDGVIAIGTTALAAERRAEDRLLREASLTRGGYVDYAVQAPSLSRMTLRNDPEEAALLGSSRATVVAAGLLAALARERAVDDIADAVAALDAVAIPADPELSARGVIDLALARQRWPQATGSRPLTPA